MDKISLASDPIMVGLPPRIDFVLIIFATHIQSEKITS